MNFGQRLLRLGTTGSGLLLILAALFFVAPVLVAPAQGALVDPKIKTSPDADKPANAALITAAVKGQIELLTGDDPVKRTTAREALIGELNAPSGAGVQGYSKEFFDAYTKELNTQLTPLANDKDVVIRLNAAIIVARVAEKVDNSWLMPITLVLLTDKSDAVVNWGLKAARFILPPVLQAGTPQNQQKLLAAIKAHADNAMLLPLVYESLSLNYQVAKPNMPGRGKMVIAIVPEVLSVMQTRLTLYEKQYPPEPMAEVPATVFLAFPTTWSEIKGQPKLQLQVVQALADLIGLAGQRAVTAPQQQRDQLEGIIRQAASALGAIAIKENAQNILGSMTTLSKIGQNSPNLAQLVKDVPTVLKTYPAWAAIKPPPIAKPATAPSAPSSAPATTAPVTAAAPAK